MNPEINNDMKFLDKKYITSFLWTVAMMALCSSCVYDSFPEGNGSEGGKDEDSYLALTISLQSTGTRAGDGIERYDDEIDLSGVKLLFFDTDNKLFKTFGYVSAEENEKLEFIPIESDGSLVEWYIRIPVPVSDEDFVGQIRGNDFKIAVLANWPDNTPILTTKDNVTLNTLHHLVNDNIYTSESAFKSLLNTDGKMGMFRKWTTEDTSSEKITTSVTPSENFLIPMYGIQEYKALGAVWVEGTTFDLSNFNKLGPSNYDYSNISLLRSIAKVEVLIPVSFESHSVFLRNMNDNARCEPVDVSTSTGEIWKNVGDKNSKGNTTEWGKLKERGSFLGSEEKFENDLEWYYGNWFDSEHLDLYPQILNPFNEIVDCVAFIQTDEYTENNITYDRYLLYVPEKFIDDFKTQGDKKSDPKICHIQFRSKDFEFGDIDDNSCYRIYFTEGGVSSTFLKDISNGDNAYPDFELDEESDEINTWENRYENNPAYLNDHWPIIRNHIYQFKVDEAGGKIAVELRILPWKKRDIVVEW